MSVALAAKSTCFSAAAADEQLSLKGKKIAISATGTDRYWTESLSGANR
jgi:hypothetical protein